MNSSIWAIPGFLGLPQDWQFLNDARVQGVNLYDFNCDSLGGWAKEFNDWILSKGREPSILMGYSLGGRLALHALIERPEQWKAAIIISTHVGLREEKDKSQRLEQDKQWARRFEKEEWLELMQAWNSQEIFQHDFQFTRFEKDYHRLALAKVLVNLSLGNQKDLIHDIKLLPMPLLWITGSQDVRYQKVAEKLCFRHSLSGLETISDAGHRCPWAKPKIFALIIEKFLCDCASFEPVSASAL